LPGTGAVRCTASAAKAIPTATMAQPVTSTIRPIRADSLSLTAADIRLPNENGTTISPVVRALRPSPSCHRIEMMNPTLVIPAKKATAKIAPAEKDDCASRLGLSSGSLPRRSAHTSRHARSAKAIAQPPKHR
jgi:hypothetical protein